MATLNRALVQGERVRLTPEGPLCTVVRVTPCAAYVGIPRVRPHPDPARAANGETITSTRVEPISAHAFVYREAQWSDYPEKMLRQVAVASLLHTQDEHCDVDPATDMCRGCGVEHGEPCLDCGARAFHTDACPTYLEDLAMGGLE